MTACEMAQLALDRQGFIVMVSNCPRSIGEVMNEIDNRMNDALEPVPGPVVVIAESNLDEMRSQHHLLQVPFPEFGSHLFYYRVVAE